jgi:TRAP-type C4-dicarboxylate transport system permease small subunit
MVKNLVFPEWYVMWPLAPMFALIAVEFVFRLHRLLTGPRVARREGGQV